ncbi:MAG: tRNA-2-methylthio-N(6)-dimethylallyladenosine synthase [marine bacterium B5-7]|nr:MAG: tRNA-2-methylthio-N(6)-dimethylallyladenosine synthase [marine bacterium B5-7]
MNVYDSEKMADILKAENGLTLTENIDEADVALFNTCSVREKAQEKVFSDLGRVRKLKEKNPNIIIGVGGCVASQEGEAIVKRAPYVDLVFGPQTLHRLPDMIAESRTQKKAVVDISFPEIEKFDRLPTPTPDGPSAFVSIMEGCSKYCSFCVVPYTRGTEISRPFDDVIAETVVLAEKGVKEITFLGQNVNDYLGPMHDGGTADLALLIRYTAEIEGIERIRYTTSHPNAFSDSLIQAYADVPKLCNQLHLPVQCGSDRVLSNMKRGYTVLEFKSKIRKLKKVRPDISITSDFIVGFPGETPEDFQKTMDLIQEIDFDNSFSFIYSKRPGTPAASLPDETTPEEKKQRLAIMQNRLKLQQMRRSQALIGTTQTILVTGPSKRGEGQFSGRTECNRVVNFAAASANTGDLIQIEITEALPNSLRGNVVEINA